MREVEKRQRLVRQFAAKRAALKAVAKDDSKPMDERFKAMAEQYPDIRTDQYHIDILTAQFVMNPDRFDVVVGSNLFGDILSDLGPACTGTIGIAPSGSINPERTAPSLYEPVHGSAPDIAGKGLANPIATIASFGMALRYSFDMSAEAELLLFACGTDVPEPNTINFISS